MVNQFPVVYNAWFGAFFVLIALGCALFSLSRSSVAREQKGLTNS